MSEKLIEITRGSLVETSHNGDIVIVNSIGDILYYCGNPLKRTYWRSAAKPIQALNVILSGADKTFDFTDKELAIMCASHYGEENHLKVLKSILSKIGLSKENVLGGTVTSLSSEYALELAYNQTKLNSLYSDCSGKHVGFLSVCKYKNYSIESYKDLNNPVQQDILRVIANMTDVKIKDIGIGIDGCSVPVHAIPLKNMALAYAKLINPEKLDLKYKKASNRIFKAMTNHPEMISGTGGFCTDLISACNKKLVGKIGAEGVYCVGIKGHDIGIAMKMESGNMSVLPPTVIHVLKELDVLTNSELKSLSKYYPIPNINDLGDRVGEIKAVFNLIKM